MPWAFEKAGFTQTVFIMVLCGIMCYYTAYLCIKAAEKARGKSEKTSGPGLPEFQVSYFQNLLFTLSVIDCYIQEQ